jgi:hypothetical protein
MLDWSNYRNPINLDLKLDIQKLYNNVIGDTKGICYTGGNDSHVVIQTKKLGVKVYKENLDKLPKLINFHTNIKPIIYKEHRHIQKVYEIKNVNTFTYSLQEWIEGETLLNFYNNKNLSIDQLNLILNDLYLNILIPFWSKGLIWVDGCLSNFCLNTNLVMIDTDNMYKTASEIIDTPNIFLLRNKARLKNMNKHSELIYNLCSVIKDVNYHNFLNLYKDLNCIYVSEINDHYYDNCTNHFNEFMPKLNYFLK